MARTLEQYGAGAGIPIGAGLGGTVAILAGLETEFAVLTGVGVAGGLVVGSFAGRFADANVGRMDWRYRVGTYTVVAGLVIGALFGMLTAWMVVSSFLTEATAGAATGGVFSMFMNFILLSAAQKRGAAESPPKAE